jgi:L-fuculose-phosphate aldolase
LLFERQLTDAAGGNVSARVGDLVCITPRYSGSKHQWHLRPEQVIVSDLQGNMLAGEGEISREAKVHYRLYTDFPDGGAVVHAHARNALVFASACQPIEPVLEDTLKFGTIRVSRYAPAHSGDLAEFIAAELAGQDEHIRKQAAGVLAPWHGLFVVGKDLDAAFDATERIDTNARCILLSRLLPGKQAYDPQSIRKELEEALGRYK